LKNLGAVLEAAGSSLKSVVKVNVFLADMNDFAAMNEAYGKVYLFCCFVDGRFGAIRNRRGVVLLLRLCLKTLMSRLNASLFLNRVFMVD